MNDLAKGRKQLKGKTSQESLLRKEAVKIMTMCFLRKEAVKVTTNVHQAFLKILFQLCPL